MTWPVDPLVAADSAQPRPLARPRAGHAPRHAQVTQATVPAPTLLVLHARLLLGLLLPLEVRLGEGLHGGQQPHLGHLPAQGHRLGRLLSLATVHGERGRSGYREAQLLSHIPDSPNRTRLSDSLFVCSGIIGNSSLFASALLFRRAPDTQAAASLDIYIKSVFISHCLTVTANSPELGRDTDHKIQRSNILCLERKITSLHCPQFLSIYEYKEVFLV